MSCEKQITIRFETRDDGVSGTLRPILPIDVEAGSVREMVEKILSEIERRSQEGNVEGAYCKNLLGNKND